MTTCRIQQSPTIELYFYDELADAERHAVKQHLAECEECRRALEELTLIRTALESCPAVKAPPGGDWSAFMLRLDTAIRADAAPPSSTNRRQVLGFGSHRVTAVLAMAALIVFVTFAVFLVMRNRSTPIGSEPANGRRPRPVACHHLRRVRSARAGHGAGADQRAASRTIQARRPRSGHQRPWRSEGRKLGLRAHARLDALERYAPLSANVRRAGDELARRRSSRSGDRSPPDVDVRNVGRRVAGTAAAPHSASGSHFEDGCRRDDWIGAMRITRLRQFALAVGLLVLLPSASSAFMEAAESRRMARAKDFIADEQWTRAIDDLRAAADDPREPNKDEALFWLAHSLNQDSDFASAVDAIRRLEREFPSSRWVKPARSLLIELAQKLRRDDVLWWTAAPAPARPSRPAPPVPPAAPVPPATCLCLVRPSPRLRQRPLNSRFRWRQRPRPLRPFPGCSKRGRLMPTSGSWLSDR